MRNLVSVCLKRRPAVGEAVSLEHFSIERVKGRRGGGPKFETAFLSVDPFLRCRFNADTGVDYTQPYQLGQVIQSAGIGVGDSGVVVQPFDAWQWSSEVLLDETSSSVTPVPAALGLCIPVTALLGVVGTTGLTAFCGIVHHAPVDSQTVLVVSGAAGAVGHLVGQIAKLKSNGRAHVVGICGSDAKGAVLRQRCGFDAVVNRHSSSMKEDLARVLDGRTVTHYFDNAGGPVSDAVIERMGTGSSIILCGQIASYNSDEPYPPPLPLSSATLAVERCISRERYLVLNYKQHFPAALSELAWLVASGQLVSLESTTCGGVEAAPQAFIDMMAGGNLGKALVDCHVSFPWSWRIANFLRASVLPNSFKGYLAQKYLGESVWQSMT